MRTLRAFVIAFLCVLYASPLHAKNYEVGTIGFLYEECQKAIQVETVDEFYDSWCMQFANNSYRGLLLASFINHHDHSKQNYADECLGAMQEEREYLSKSLLCKHIGEGIPSSASNLEERLFWIKGFFRWIRWLEKYEPDMLYQPIFPYINDGIRPGDWCQYVNKAELKDVAFNPSPQLENVDLEKWRKTTKIKEPSITSINKTCKEDIEKSEGNLSVFITSSCGAGTIGTMSGMSFYDITKDDNEYDGACKDDFEKLHKYEIAAKRICLTKDVSPMEYAEKMLAMNEYDPVEDRYVPKQDNDDFDFCEESSEK